MNLYQALLNLIGKTQTPIGQAARERSPMGMVNYWKNPDSLKKAFNPISMVAGAGTVGGLKAMKPINYAPDTQQMINTYMKLKPLRRGNPYWRYSTEGSDKAFRIINTTLPRNRRAAAASYLSFINKK